jgi:hypothetical protein
MSGCVPPAPTRPANEFAAPTTRCPPARTARAIDRRCASATGVGGAKARRHAAGRMPAETHKRVVRPHARRLKPRLGNHEVRLRGLPAQSTGGVPRRRTSAARRPRPTRAVEALFAERVSARQGLWPFQPRVHPPGRMPAPTDRAQTSPPRSCRLFPIPCSSPQLPAVPCKLSPVPRRSPQLQAIPYSLFPIPCSSALACYHPPKHPPRRTHRIPQSPRPFLVRT